MGSLFILSLITAFATVSGHQDGTSTPPYPNSSKGTVTDDYHGVTIADPYRWLEDPNSAETKAWAEAQNTLTHNLLDSYPGRDKIASTLSKIINFERFSSPEKVGIYYFYGRNTGLQNQSVLYVTDKLGDTGRVLLDPNTLSKDGTVALSGTEVSPNGKYLAYSVSRGGSDWQEWYVREVKTGRDLGDHIQWSKFSGASWAKDGSGFYYSAYEAPKAGQTLTGGNYFQKIYFHKLGAKKDQLVYERKNQKDWGFGAYATEDGRYLVISVSKGTGTESQIFIKDLRNPRANVQEILKGFDASYQYLGNDGPTFYFITDKGAPTKKIIALDINNPRPGKWRTVVAPKKETITSASLLGNRFFVTYLKDAVSVVYRFETTGKALGPIKLPGLGTASGFGGRRFGTETFYTFSNFITPSTIYRYNLSSAASAVWKKPKVAFDGGKYEVKQEFYRSKDGTRVPMFIVSKKGQKRDGNNPTLLYGYGGFDISLTPSFSSSVASWLELGGTYVLANLRGGGEYGNAWHDGGRLLKKQNVFDDFIAAGEYLISSNITSKSKLAINGGSNGGLLVGACLNQRPDLFAAAIPEVGVMDMLRFNKFTIGWAWESDYGSPQKKEYFDVLVKYSPLHNIKHTAYPPTLILTGDHDDRVVPAHSYKYAAALQTAQAGSSPILIRIESSAGHGAGTPVSKIIETYTDKYAFLAKSLGMKL